MNLPSPNDVLYFVEVANTLNISRAAERLGITQPSLTQALNRLEHEIGVPLLFRSKKGVSLTPAGKRMLFESQTLIMQWGKIREQALASIEQVQGSYKFGCHPSVGIYSLPEVMKQLLLNYPKLEIHLSHMISRQVFEAVVSLELDIALVINPPEHPDLIIKKLCRDEMGFWVRKDFESPSGSELQNPKSDKSVLIYDPNLTQVQDLLKKVKKMDAVFHRRIHSSNLEFICSLVLAGVGVGILPGRVAKAIGKDELKPLSPPWPKFADELALVYRMEHKNIQSIKVIVQALSAYFQK